MQLKGDAMSDESNPETQLPEEDADDKTPLEQFIFHQRRGLEEFGKAMESLLPPGFPRAYAGCRKRIRHWIPRID